MSKEAYRPFKALGEILQGREISRRSLLIGGGEAVAVIELAGLLAACGNSSVAYKDIYGGISSQEFRDGIEHLTDPLQRSTVVIEAKTPQGVDVFGHGVITASPDNPNQLVLITAYHIPRILHENFGNNVQWKIRVAKIPGITDQNNNFIDLPSLDFTPSDGTQRGDTDGIAQLKLPANAALTQAVMSQQLIPAEISQDSLAEVNHDTQFAIVIADSRKGNEGQLTLLKTSRYNSDARSVTSNIISGGYCLGYSGQPIYKTEKGKLTNTIVGISSSFVPDTTDPSQQFDISCTTTSMIFVPFSKRA